MRKVLSVLVCILLTIPAFATGDATPTSKGYVDAQMDTLQDNLPGAAANTVVTTTATAGETGTKAIYDASGNYADQQNALVTAEDANTAIQMAIQGELVCREYDPTGQYCYVYDVHPTVRNNILPNGYTALEYIESTGTQYLNLGQPIGSGENITTKFEYTADVAGVWFGARAGDTYSAGFVFEFAQYSNNLFILSHNTTVTAYRGFQVNGLSFMTPYTLNWYGNPFQNPTLSPNMTFNNLANRLNESNYLVTPAYNAFLFAYNRAGSVSGKKPMRIYYFTVEGKMNLIPARRDSDGELGMYDLVSNTFFTNQGAGTFTAGPDLNVYMPSGN